MWNAALWATPYRPKYISLKIAWSSPARSDHISDCMFLSCQKHVSEWIYTLKLPECQGTPSSKQVQYLKYKWLQRESNPWPLSHLAQPFSQTGLFKN